MLNAIYYGRKRDRLPSQNRTGLRSGYNLNRKDRYKTALIKAFLSGLGEPAFSPTTNKVKYRMLTNTKPVKKDALNNAIIAYVKQQGKTNPTKIIIHLYGRDDSPGRRTMVLYRLKLLAASNYLDMEIGWHTTVKLGARAWQE